jgi:1,4-alpha-glucan branching enzyme
VTELLGPPQDDPGSVVVRFRLPHAVEADKVSVVGDFNDWSNDADLMDRDDEGFVLERPLTRGRSYRYRYLLDGERWENDWAADAYVPNEFGGDDSVLDLTDAAASEGLPTTSMVQEATTDQEGPPPAKPKRTRKKG